MQIFHTGPIVEVSAPAKLNLFLELLARRDDGFHEIETLMTAVSIFDTLKFSSHTDGQLRLKCTWVGGLLARISAADKLSPERQSGSDNDRNLCDWGDLPEAADNIVLTAVERLRQRAGVEQGATIQLLKRIPSAAGLGGASSDAAAALAAANMAWKLGWSSDKLTHVAAELGSDIPFFFFGGAAICRGRGERIERVAGLARMHVVVARPPAGLSTAQVYRHCRVAEKPVSIQPLVSALRNGNLASAGRLLLNRLEEAAARQSPWIARMQREFERLDLPGHQMSGSGTSYFGICRDARHARRVASRLRAAKIGQVYCATTVAAPHRRP